MKFLRNHRHLLIVTTLFASTFFLAGYFERYHIPKIKRWLLVEVEKQSQKYLPIRIWPKNVKINVFPLGLTFYHVRLLPKIEMAQTLSPTWVELVELSLSPWALFKGEMRLSRIVVEGGQFNVNMGFYTSNKHKTSQSFSMDLADMESLPIEKIILKKINLNAYNLPEGKSISLNDMNFSIESRYQTLRVNFLVDSLLLQSNQKAELFSGRILTQFLLDRDGLYVSNLSITQQQTQLQGSGAITGDVLNQKFKDVSAKIVGNLSLEDLNFIKKIFMNFSDVKNDFSSIKVASGTVKFETDFKYNFKDSLKNSFRANFALKSANLKLNRFDIGELSLVGKISEKDLHFTKFLIQNDFGQIAATELNFSFLENIKVSGTISTDGLDMKKFLASLGLPNSPVHTTLAGQLPCEGVLSKKFLISCSGQISGKDFSVLGKVKDLKSPVARAKSIVSFSDYSITGTVQVNDTAVQYKTDLRIGNSKGESSGVINYQNGFKINYSTPQLNFSDLSDLAQLKPEGRVALKGFTAGSSQAATIELNATGENLFIKDFELGNVNFSFNYAKGLMSIKNIEGQINKTQYNGQLNLDLPSEKLQLTATSRYLDIEDIVKAFKRKVRLPISITGTGSVNVSASGPFQFNLLSYTFTSALYRGTIADESFDQLNFNVTSQNGHVKSNRIEISKGTGLIRATGQVEPNGFMNLDVTGQNFQIEQFENLSRLKLNLTGNLNFNAAITRHILKPDIYFKSQITKMMVDDLPTKNSEIELKITDSEISSKAQFMGSTVAMNFRHARNTKADTQLQIAVKSWDFAQMFSMFTDNLREGNYQTNLTGNLDLTFPNSDPFKYFGRLDIETFKVKNGSIEMSSSQPFSLIAKAGLLTSHNFEITGQNTYLRLRTGTENNQELGLTLEGRINLALATIFTPFLNDLRGTANFSYELSGTYKNPQLNGSAFLEDGFFKIKGLPHSFEQVNANANFNNSKIIINAIKGQLGGGRFSSLGNIDIQSPQKMPIDIKGEFQDVKLNVPEGFLTRGNGDFFIRGDWFPFTVGVNYTVHGGSIEKKTSELNKVNSIVKPSSYLPQFLLAERFTPVTLDLNINIKKILPVRMFISRIDIRTDVTGDMRVLGPPTNPLLTGKINIIKGGKVTFRSNTFEIKNGSVEYNQSAPENPELNIQANATVRAQLRDSRTRDYDVDLLVQGTASKPKITMSSQPPLVENELISLLTLGFINEESLDQGETTAGEKLANTSYQLTSAFLNENLGINQVLEKQLGLRFDFSSSYDTSDKAEKHKFILSKQWSPKFGTSASRQIGKTNSNNVKAEYKLNKNLSLIGQWDGQEPTGSEQQTTSDKDLNIFGLDMEYKVDFR